ncbi:MAG TPA: hypothetical protein VG328_11100 [Stellaceae bacterium]|jgi:hypothetical protein|nr:hypothetical protein [Stellaceae bacterium]
MSNRDRVLDFLNSAGPDGATNADIVSSTGIKPHQQVFQITQALIREGLIKGIQSGKDWRFWPRKNASFESKEQEAKRLTSTLSIVNATAHIWDQPDTVTVGVKINWIPLGRVTLSETSTLVFPRSPTAPGLYRFRIRKESRESLYVGETENLARRFGNYRHPGPTQQTSMRINVRLRADLKAGADVSVACVTEGAWITSPSGAEKPADFTLKAVRCLLENAAIIASNGTEIECLNL